MKSFLDILRNFQINKQHTYPQIFQNQYHIVCKAKVHANISGIFDLHKQYNDQTVKKKVLQYILYKLLDPKNKEDNYHPHILHNLPHLSQTPPYRPHKAQAPPHITNTADPHMWHIALLPKHTLDNIFNTCSNPPHIPHILNLDTAHTLTPHKLQTLPNISYKVPHHHGTQDNVDCGKEYSVIKFMWIFIYILCKFKGSLDIVCSLGMCMGDSLIKMRLSPLNRIDILRGCLGILGSLDLCKQCIVHQPKSNQFNHIKSIFYCWKDI